MSSTGSRLRKCFSVPLRKKQCTISARVESRSVEYPRMPPHAVSTRFCPKATLRHLQDGFGDGLLKFARALMPLPILATVKKKE
jgi:hypothetical protein